MTKFAGMLLAIIALSGAISYAITSPTVVNWMAANNAFDSSEAVSAGTCSGSAFCPMSAVKSACSASGLQAAASAERETAESELEMQHELFMLLGYSEESDVLFDPAYVLEPAEPQDVTLTFEQVWPDMSMQ